MRKWIVFFVILQLTACSFNSEKNNVPTQPVVTPFASQTSLPFPTQAKTLLSTTVPATATLTQVPTETSAPTKTIPPVPTSAPKEYVLQEGTPRYLQNFVYPEVGCKWMGMAGQVFDKDGIPQSGLLVIVKAVLNESTIEVIGMTGLATAYGEGGYEIKLGEQALTKKNGLTAQLYDLKGNALSDPIRIDAIPGCKYNLILVDFKHN